MKELIKVSYYDTNSGRKNIYLKEKELVGWYERSEVSEMMIEGENGFENYVPGKAERAVYHLTNIYEGKELEIMLMAISVGQDKVMEMIEKELVWFFK